MSIIRSKRENNFTVIDNKVFERGFLSFQARGLLCTLLSHHDNWSISVSELIKATEGTAKKSGRDVVYQMIDELMISGYIVRTKRSDGKMDYTVFDKPNPENPYYGKDVIRGIPITEKPNPENRTLIKTETTTSTEKELIKTEGEEISLPDWLSESDWNDFVDFRKSIKKSMTNEAKRRAINKLSVLRAGGYNPSNVIDQSIVNGWAGLFETKNKQKSYYSDDGAGYDQAYVARELAETRRAMAESYA